VLPSRARVPLLLRLRRWRERPRQPRRGRRRRWLRRLMALQTVRRLFQRVSGIASIPMAMLLAVLLAPFLLTATIVVGLPVLILSIVRRLLRTMRRRTMGRLARFAPAIERTIGVLGISLLDNEFELLARRANGRADVDVWMAPYPGTTHPLRLKAPLVAVVPDLVYAEFPSLFDSVWAARIDAKARRLVGRARAVITYSRHTADRHVAEHLGIPRARVRVIPHAPFDAGRSVPSRDEAQHVIAAYLAQDLKDEKARTKRTGGSPIDYVRGLPFDEIAYLFVSAQVRPTKNYLNLFRAFERLLRRRYRNVKLVMTGIVRPDDATGLRDYLTKARLDLDIVSLPDLPSPVHGAFMRLAALTDVPTLFEGGFPFPFSESLSVGTPVAMSAIPVTREVIPADLQPLMLFDPYDIDSIATRLAWCLDHRDELLARQQTLHATLCRRTWRDAADEYVQVLRSAAGREGAERVADVIDVRGGEGVAGWQVDARPPERG
jgi:glycosyltransferase involved in cell wall biosynthesis